MVTKTEFLTEWFRRVWAERDSKAIDEMFVEDGEARGLGAHTLVGPEGFKRFHQALCRHLDDIRIEIDRSIEDGDWVSALCTARAVSSQSGDPVTFCGNVWVRVQDEQIVEAYNHWDFSTLFAQLDLSPDDVFANVG